MIDFLVEDLRALVKTNKLVLRPSYEKVLLVAIKKAWENYNSKYFESLHSDEVELLGSGDIAYEIDCSYKVKVQNEDGELSVEGPYKQVHI